MGEKKILLVDDEIDLLETIKAMLTASGYNVISANNGIEGLRMAVDENPDIILLDVRMPKMDGYTMLRELKKDERTKSIPVIMLTIYDKLKDRIKLEGAEDYLEKSSDHTELLTKISRILKK